MAINRAVRFRVFKRDKFSCRYCGKKPPEALLQIDHVRPVSFGGTDLYENLATSCSDCNRGKGDVPLVEGKFDRIKQRTVSVKMIAETLDKVRIVAEVNGRQIQTQIDIFLLSALSKYEKTLQKYSNQKRIGKI